MFISNTEGKSVFNNRLKFPNVSGIYMPSRFTGHISIGGNFISSLKEWMICLADFGLSKQGSNASDERASVSGAERYKALEMEWGTMYTRKADVFFLGCVALEIIAFGCVKRMKGFDEFRAPHKPRNCHRTNPVYTCFRHNLRSVKLFIKDQLRPISVSKHSLLDIVQMDALAEKGVLGPLPGTSGNYLFGLPVHSPTSVSGTGSGEDRGQGSTRTIRSGSKDWVQGSRRRLKENGKSQVAG
jgi:serine/threonine protein kinase